MSVTLETVRPRKLAAVRREVFAGAVGAAWGPAISQVWGFIRGQAGLWSGGHNVFVYYQTPDRPNAPILCDFGVEVTRAFDTFGEVYATETPSGEAAVCVHRGACPATLKAMTMASLMVMNMLTWKGPAGLGRRGLCGHAGAVMVILS